MLKEQPLKEDQIIFSERFKDIYIFGLISLKLEFSFFFLGGVGFGD